MTPSFQYRKPLAKAYAELSSSWARHDFGRYLLREQLEPISRQARLVDVGCGNGIDLHSYFQMGFRHLIGIEPNKLFRQQARHLLQKLVSIYDGRFENMPLEDSSVDVVVSRFALHYCVDISAAFQETARVLKPNGRFLAIVSHPDADQAEPHNRDGTLSITLFNGKISITYPSHSWAEYRNSAFDDNFRLQESISYCGLEQDRSKNRKPNAYLFVAKRLG